SVTGAPVLLVAPAQLPPSTADALDGVTEAVIVGGTAAVSEHVAGHVAEHAGSTRRLAGDERYGTAVAVAADLLGQGVALQRVWATDGAAWADALAAGPAVARAGETFLLVDGAAGGSDAATDAWLRQHADEVEAGRVVGGSAAVGDDAARLLAERIG
ncbi:MAG TPA: cell wall-binding repeat-containing protein, partial [Egibacteraceae bacterium]|nr:cell wall-binding repeat-containing protein [Egibacteraceae bacterium]